MLVLKADLAIAVWVGKALLEVDTTSKKQKQSVMIHDQLLQLYNDDSLL
jgi:hypothetical protein